MSIAGDLARALVYALVTAGVLIGLAILLGRGEQIAEEQAYFEIHDHRIGAACAHAQVMDGLNLLLVEAGREPLPTPDVAELDCGGLPAIDPDETPAP